MNKLGIIISRTTVYFVGGCKRHMDIPFLEVMINIRQLSLFGYFL